MTPQLVRRIEADLDDVQLMALVQAADASAFAALVKRHHGRCYALAWRILQDRGGAEDAVQEAFMKLWRGAERFDPSRGRFTGWLTTITTRCCLDGRRLMKPVVDLEDAATIADERPRADRLAEGRDVHRLMAQLPPRQRAAISLFYLEGQTMHEVAHSLDSNMKSVESLLSRGRAALRALYENTCSAGVT